MNKIIFFIASLCNGGAERVVSVLSGQMLSYFETVEILTFYERPLFYDVDSRVKIKSIEGDTHTKNVLKNCIYLRKYLDFAKPTVFVSFMAPFNILALLSIRNNRSYPIIVADRSDPRYECRNWLRSFLRDILYLNKADEVVIQSLKNIKYYPDKVQSKISVIFNPSSLPEKCFGIALRTPKEKYFVQVARLDAVKNQKMLIRSFCNVHAKHGDYKLIIYGDGPLRSELQEMIEELDIQDNVLLPGRIKNVADTIKNAEAFVLSSHYEGMSNSLLEAMGIGLPVISTEVSGAVDLITNQHNGIIVPCDDEQKMAEAMLSVIENKEQSVLMANNAIDVNILLDLKTITSKWLNLFEGAISKYKK